MQDGPRATSRAARPASATGRRATMGAMTEQTPGERRLAHPPSDRYRAAEDAAAAAADAPDPAASLPRGLAIAVAIAAIVGAVAIVVLGGVLTVTSGLVVVAGATGWGVAAGLRFGAGDAPRSGDGGSSSPSRCRSARCCSASWACGSTPVSRAASCPCSTTSARSSACSSRSSSPTAAVVGLAGRPVTAAITLRRPTEADHPRLIAQVDEWWGGRKVHALLPRLWFQHFTGDVVGRRGRRRPAGRVPRRVRQPRPPGRRPTSTWSASARTIDGRAWAGRLYERFFDDVRAQRGVRRVTAVTWPGNRASVGFHRALGFSPFDGPGTQNLYGTPAFADYDADGDDRVVFSREL